jgi:hypothetical protein
MVADTEQFAFQAKPYKRISAACKRGGVVRLPCGNYQLVRCAVGLRALPICCFPADYVPGKRR